MSVVTDYIEMLTDGEKTVLNSLRNIVYEVVPEAEDAFSYGVPTYRYKGKYLLAFASNKNFMSIYPGAQAVEVFKNELAAYKQSKGTISFTAMKPLDETLLRNIILLCKDTIDQKNN